jgi:hypothetical protein
VHAAEHHIGRRAEAADQHGAGTDHRDQFPRKLTLRRGSLFGALLGLDARFGNVVGCLRLCHGKSRIAVGSKTARRLTQDKAVDAADAHTRQPYGYNG